METTGEGILILHYLRGLYRPLILRFYDEAFENFKHLTLEVKFSGKKIPRKEQ